MALMMSLYEAVFQSVPGAGIVIGGAITALANPRAALAVAGIGSLGITVAAWFALAGLRPRADRQSAAQPAASEPQVDPALAATRRDSARTPAVRHQ